CQQWSSNPFTF
nr:immunoglobulin light chain junction region [Mus musculus]NSM01591.1 immunoglobulin light chain junction region [Mus musculus]NSM02597.1 immunoglobulin light chain junction region [Mus musculus]NSM03003.1 immunoglobulin light chain junction region [Mus musculus]